MFEAGRYLNRKTLYFPEHSLTNEYNFKVLCGMITQKIVSHNTINIIATIHYTQKINVLVMDCYFKRDVQAWAELCPDQVKNNISFLKILG